MPSPLPKDIFVASWHQHPDAALTAQRLGSRTLPWIMDVSRRRRALRLPSRITTPRRSWHHLSAVNNVIHTVPSSMLNLKIVVRRPLTFSELRLTVHPALLQVAIQFRPRRSSRIRQGWKEAPSQGSVPFACLVIVSLVPSSKAEEGADVLQKGKVDSPHAQLRHEGTHREAVG